MNNDNMKIGVLALQGDFKEHIEVLKSCDIDALKIRTLKELEQANGLIIPGGESTTIGKLMEKNNLTERIKEKAKQGMPIFGTCAGTILLSKEIEDSNQPKLDLLDIKVKRNDYGPQIESFEKEINSDLGKLNGVFIRAPVIEEMHNGIKVLAELNNKPVLVQDKNILASTFHPELTKDKKVHKHFIEMVKKG